MKETSTSSSVMKTENATDMTETPAPAAGPMICAKIKIRLTKTVMIHVPGHHIGEQPHHENKRLGKNPCQFNNGH